PADEIAVRVAERSAGPIATRAGDRIRLAVTLVHDVAGGGSVGRVSAGAVGDRATDDGAADHACSNACTAPAAIATGFGAAPRSHSTGLRRGSGPSSYPLPARRRSQARTSSSS